MVSYGSYGSLYSTAPLSYSAAPISYAPAVSYAAPQTVSISESEGDAPEGTPLSAALCHHLGVPVGTLWGLPSGQRRSEETEAPVTQKIPNPSATPTSDKQPGTQV
jgi:hypothetical protein